MSNKNKIENLLLDISENCKDIAKSIRNDLNSKSDGYIENEYIIRRTIEGVMLGIGMSIEHALVKGGKSHGEESIHF